MPDEHTERAVELMTRLRGAHGPPPTVRRRYLWTDAFAVCNFLGLARATGDERYTELALRLVDQVHHVLGRHRADDARTGWISGLDARRARPIRRAAASGSASRSPSAGPASRSTSGSSGTATASTSTT